MKKILFIFLSLFCLFVYSGNVNAEDIDSGGGAGVSFGEPVKEFDDDGHIVMGEICIYNVSSNGSYSKSITKIYGEKLYIIQHANNETNFNLMICGSNITFNRIVTSYNDRNEFVSDSVYTGNYNNKANIGTLYGSDSSGAYLDYSTIPIFDDSDPEFEQKVQNYLDKGDLSGAENANEFNNDLEYSDDVVKPLNLHTFGRIFNLTVNGVDNTDVTDTEGVYNTIHTGTTLGLNWSPPDNNVISDYSYDVRFRVTYYVNTRDNRTTTDWCNIVSDYPYERNSYVDINTGESVPRTSDVSETCRINESEFNKLGLYWREYFVYKNYSWYVGAQNVYIVDADIQVRNRCNGKCSNWVSVNSAANTGYNSTNVKDNNGNVVNDDDYHGQDTSTYNDPTDSDNNFNVDINNVSINGILQYIRDGFGLLGSNGILSLMGKTFLFLPSSIWIILKFFVSMMVAISIVKLLKDVIL